MLFFQTKCFSFFEWSFSLLLIATWVVNFYTYCQCTKNVPDRLNELSNSEEVKINNKNWAEKIAIFLAIVLITRAGLTEWDETNGTRRKPGSSFSNLNKKYSL